MDPNDLWLRKFIYYDRYWCDVSDTMAGYRQQYPWYMFSLATLFVLLLSPLLGARSDKIGRRMPFLTWSTIALIIVNAVMALVALSALPNKVWVVLGLSIVIQFLYQISLIFYNALLKNVSREDNTAMISGIGEWVGWLWRIAALLLFLPIANGALAFLGTPGKHLVFLPMFIFSALFMLPLLLWFKEKKQPIVRSTENIYHKAWAGIRQLRTTHKNVWLYLLAFSLISDIVLTMQMYLAVVMGAVYHASESMKSLVLVIFLISSLFFGYVFGKLADKFGYKKILILTCFILVLNCLIFFSSSTQRVLYVIAIIWWMASGWYFGVTKAFMVKLSPPGELWEYFGLYSTFHKAASITAPLIRWWITLRLIQYPVLKYQVAGWVMTALLVVWTILMMRVKEK